MITFVAALIYLYGPAELGSHEGQSLVEYALIIVLIAIAVILAMTTLGGQINNVFNKITGSLGA